MCIVASRSGPRWTAARCEREGCAGDPTPPVVCSPAPHCPLPRRRSLMAGCGRCRPARLELIRVLVRFWGTRGSIPVPGAETLRYGGNTSCVEVRTDENRLFIFDCGTGARKLGLQLARSG